MRSWNRLRYRALAFIASHAGLLGASLLAATVIAVAAVAALAPDRPRRSSGTRAASAQAGSPGRYEPKPPPLTGVSPTRSPTAGRRCSGARDLVRATSVARATVARLIAQQTGRLNDPSYPTATPLFQRVLRSQPQLPPWQLGAHARIAVTGARLPQPGTAVVRTSVRIERGGLAPFPLVVTMSYQDCRWLAGGF